MWTLRTTAVVALLFFSGMTMGEIPAGQDADVVSVVAGSNAFAVDVYARLAAEEKGNLLFSPASLHAALSMVYAGAAGATAEQTANALHVTLPPQRLSSARGKLQRQYHTPLPDEQQGKNAPAYSLVVACALWRQGGASLKAPFLQLLRENGASVNELDFQQAAEAQKTINDWAVQQTSGKITDLIRRGDIGSATRLVLTNAVYFKSNWSKKFPRYATRDQTFILSQGTAATVPMMHLTSEFGYRETAGFQMLELPYERGELSMLIVLPTRADGLREVEKTLAADSSNKWLGGLLPEQIDVTLPKFGFTRQFAAGDILAAMGMKDAFIPGKADFTAMADEPVSLSAIIHKALIAVNEDGTEAAAATAVVARSLAAILAQPKKFVADHPFVLVIRHNATGEILFMGRVADPRSN